MASPPTLEAIRALLPNRIETIFLRACLHSGPNAERAWKDWLAIRPDPWNLIQQERLNVKGLLPTLAENLRRNQITPPPPARSLLNVARAREQLRGNTMREICAGALGVLRDAAIPFVALKGAALAESVYGGWGLRHSHDIDVLLHPDRLTEAASRIVAAETAQEQSRHPANGSVTLLHATGTPIALHSRLFRLPHFAPPIAPIWERCDTVRVAGIEARILSPADCLVHTLGQAACSPSRDTLRWVGDAWRMVDCHPDLDWSAALELARQGRLSLPLGAQLRYMRESLDAPIPDDVLDRLGELAALSSRFEREAALGAARAGRRDSYRSLLRASPSWPAKREVLRWMLMPSADYMIAGGAPANRAALLTHYALRPIRYALRRMRHPSPPRDGAAGGFTAPG
jgi:hypothetical protein